MHPVNRSGSVAHAARDLSAWSAKMETGIAVREQAGAILNR
jgi:hypothetical protein